MTQQIKLGDYTIDLERKRIKHLHLAIYRDTGRIRLSAPMNLSDLQIRQFLESRLSWIALKLKNIQKQEPPVKLEFCSGETHYLEGKAYILNVIPNSKMNMLKLRDGTHIDLHLRTESSTAFRKEMFQAWHKVRLRVRCENMLVKWQQTMGVQIEFLGIRQMKTRWGTCNPTLKRVWINLELARLADEILEYIIVHELVHLFVRGHGAEFRAYMDRFLPDWPLREQAMKKYCLNAPLLPPQLLNPS